MHECTKSMHIKFFCQINVRKDSNNKIICFKNFLTVSCYFSKEEIRCLEEGSDLQKHEEVRPT